MTEMNLADLVLLTTGGEAEIYDLDPDRILRVLWRDNGKSEEKDVILQEILANESIHVPKVYEYLRIQDRAACIMEKIHGDTLTNEMRKNIRVLVKVPHILAELQKKVSSIVMPDSYPSIRDLFTFVTEHGRLQDKELTAFVTQIFNEQRTELMLCHGDFHPGNILVSNETLTIIDWSGSYSGNPIADIAHTYILMRQMPRLPGQSTGNYRVMSFVARIIAARYLNAAKNLWGFDWATFSAWTVIMSFQRVTFGLPGERDDRIAYIRKCLSLHRDGVSMKKWFRRV
jgi:serine/threonine protein kinase